MITFAIGNLRLLKLADILDVADALHRKRKEPTYSQAQVAHECNTPACAFGHWAGYRAKRLPASQRWTFRADGIRHPKYGFNFERAAEDDFAIVPGEVRELFSAVGCGDARTAKQAAKYIRGFVKKRIAAQKAA